jgi:hypothetical protein|tara:strand:+ start:4205 stop:5533 length:1329 start_codon:yes stop_codon:yes gene_type:complete
MDSINIDYILDRDELKERIKTILIDFQKNKNNLLVKRGIYLYGNPGTGKTYFIKSILNELDYDIIVFDAGDIRNKPVIENITKHNMPDINIMSLFYGKKKNIAIIMDEIDGMNSGDKGGINSLIKLIRPKKTKKQKLEEITSNPIICIGNYHIDKKIKELMKVCYSIELKTPKKSAILKISNALMPKLDNNVIVSIVNFIQGDLRKLKMIFDIYTSNIDFLKNEIILNVFQEKSFNEDTKKITKNLLNNKYHYNQHNLLMNDTDRTIVGLMWHENIIDTLHHFNNSTAINVYNKILDNICFSDYIDRITFQKQIWQFNEMSSLIKTFYNNNIYHSSFDKIPKFNPSETRFTKVLTKYSTEYNNSIFIQNLCQNLNMDKKDTLSYFLYLRDKYGNVDKIYKHVQDYELCKLDISRIYRYLDKYTKLNITSSDDEDDDTSVLSI